VISGKRGRAVSRLSGEQTALNTAQSFVEGHENFERDVATDDNTNVIDLYSVGHESVTRKMCDGGIEIPFKQGIRLHGPKGEVVRMEALFDGGAMVAAMCSTVFEMVKHRLGDWGPSVKRLRMANGTIVPSQATWRGIIDLGGVEAKGEFEVFDSGGSWAFLFGKPLLRVFKARHNFEEDTVTITDANDMSTTLENGLTTILANEDLGEIGISLTLDVKQRAMSLGGSPESDPPAREVTPLASPNDERNDCHPLPDFPVSEEEQIMLFADLEAYEEKINKEAVRRVEEREDQVGGEDMPPSRGVHNINSNIPNANITDHDIAAVYTNQPVDCAGKEDTILTRATDPFKPERVARVVMEVTIGEDLTEEQRALVETIIREFADCFALSMKEVNAIPGAVIRVVLVHT